MTFTKLHPIGPNSTLSLQDDDCNYPRQNETRSQHVWKQTEHLFGEFVAPAELYMR